MGLAGFLTAGAATQIISATCSPVSGLLWTIYRFFALLGGLGRSMCCVSSSPMDFEGWWRKSCIMIVVKVK